MSDVEVKVGQVWRDCDKRIAERYVRVVRVCTPLNPDGELYAFVVICDKWGNYNASNSTRETRINVKRMKPGATGYELVKP